MGYGSVIIVVGAIILSGVLLMSMDSATSKADEEVNEYHFDELARDAATTGLQLTVRKLAASADGGSWLNGADFEYATTTFHSGSFRTEVTPINLVPDVGSGDQVDVVARGFNGPGRQVIFARYIREYADGGIPPEFQYVIAADQWIQLQGDVSIRSVHPDRNASIFTNEDLITNGNSFLVEGFGYYYGSEFTNQEDNFVPNDDTNGDESNVIPADEPLDLRAINMDRLRSIASTTSGAILQMNDAGGATPPLVIDGDTTPILDFTQPWTLPWVTDSPDYSYAMNCPSNSCGTEENPFILVVEGPVTFVNRVEVRGWGNIVSAANVAVTPNGNGGGLFGQLTPADALEPLRTQLLLAALGNIHIGEAGGNTCMGLGPSVMGSGGSADQNQHCQSGNGGADGFTHGISLHTQGEVEMQGTPYLVGSIVAKRTYFTGGGTPQITYSGATESITDPGFEFIIPIGPILVAYSEW